MNNTFYYESGSVKANIVFDTKGYYTEQVVANNLGASLLHTDFSTHEDLYTFLMNAYPVLRSDFKVTGVTPAGKFEAVINSGFIESSNFTNTEGRSEGGVHGLIGRLVNVQVTKPATKMPVEETNYREVMSMDFGKLELRIVAHCMVDQDAAQGLADYLGKTLMEVLYRKPVNEETLRIAQNVASRIVNEWCGHRCFDPAWFKITLPQLVDICERREKELAAEEQAKAAAKDERRKARVRGQVTRSVRAVRMSHVETLTAVMGDTDAADAVLNETEAHLQIYYGCAENTKFHEVREHAVSIVNTYISDKLAALEANRTVVNNVNITVAEGVDARMVQETVNNISRTVLETNGALAENKVHVACGVDIGNHIHTGEGETFKMGNTTFHGASHKEDSPCMEGLTGASRVQWIIDNVPASYIAGNIEMYTDSQDVANWILANYHTKETVTAAFERLYGYNPAKESFVPTSQHNKDVDVLNEQINHLQGIVMERDATIADQLNTIDKQHHDLTQKNNTLNRYKSAFCDVDSVLNPLR